MEYTNLGTSGLKVSRIALGCMSFGSGGGARLVARRCGGRAGLPSGVDLGITFWDTANVYSGG
jgi:aryl-alcohol dehydrogenase-like predicted oxidoreductase